MTCQSFLSMRARSPNPHGSHTFCFPFHIVQNFQNLFFPDSYAQYNGDSADNPTSTRYFIFTLDELRASVTLQYHQYWTLPFVAVTPVEIYSYDRGDALDTSPDAATPVLVPQPHVLVSRFTASRSTLMDPTATPSLATETLTVPLADPDDIYPLTPHNDTQLREYLSTLRTLTYVYVARVSDPWSDASFVFPRAQRDWQIALTYDFTSRQHFEVTWAFSLLGRSPTSNNPHVGLIVATTLTLLLIVLYEAHTVGAAFSWSTQFLTALRAQGRLFTAAASRKHFGPSGPRIGSRKLVSGDRILEILPTREEWLARKQQEREAKRTAAQLRRELRTAPAAAPAAAGGGGSGNHAGTGGGAVDAGAESDSSHSTSSSSSSGHSSVDKLHRLTASDVLLLVRPWIVVASIGDAFLLSHCLQILLVDFDIPGSVAALPLAIAACCLMLSLLRYLDFSPGLYSTILTLQGAGPKIIRFLIGVTPLFVALTLFALVVFGRTEVRYADPSIAFITLFAFFNGDAIRETFTHTEAVGSAFLTVVGDIHLCFLTIIFTYVVSNVCIALVEEAFFNTRTPDAQDLVAASRARTIRIKLAVKQLAGADSSRDVALHECHTPAAPGKHAADVGSDSDGDLTASLLSQ